MKVELQTPTIATAAWPKVPKGEEVTASVLDSGVPVDLSKRPQSDLLLVDASTGGEKVIEHGSTLGWQLSTNGKTVAFTRQISAFLPEADMPLSFDYSGLSTIELVTLQGTPVAVQGELSRDVLTGSLRWSPDGNELAFFGYTAGREESPLLYRLNVSNHTVVWRSLKGLDVVPIVREKAQLEWTANGDLILRAAKRIGDVKPDVSTRRDWWLVAKDGTQRCLTEGIKTVPQELWPQDGRQAFVGLADGKIWRILPASGKVEDLTARFVPKIANISWPSGANNEGISEYRHQGQTYSQIIFSAQEVEAFSPYLLELGSDRITPIEKPVPSARLVAYESSVNTGIFYASDRNGLQVWRRDLRNSKSTELMEANGFLRDIAEGTFKSIEYTSLNGQKLKAWLLLPVNYQSGKRYPLVTWVYAGWMAGERPPSITIANSTCLNEQILAAHGYAVLLPSMPLTPEGTADDPMLRLPEGVLPAVDKVIEMGIADPNRLFLIGQSFGGYSTYGLVTQTDRFKAAVSLAGMSDLISLYGQFDARMRYTDYPQENLFMAALMESAQVRMGNPPWKDLGRYIRNSPITYVYRVQTPLMIIQGDMDYVAMQQGEEFFTSLYRQGKRAKFVRYWGEGHVLESPANIRDMWSQIFNWFDEFSPKGDSSTTH
ncbi:MAG: prolyl oligopeptidase family serine peptidase [Terracidiphilus sp.]|jgi:dipeptidyl aminopeptidase/acylaminoacyl peptidase